MGVPIVILFRRTSLPETGNTEDDVTSSWTNPTMWRLYSVFMVSADDGWAVGDQGTIIRWNGTAWYNVTSPTKDSLLSVFMVDANDGWAVGEGSTGTGVALIRWNGTSWNKVTCPTTDWLFSVFMVDANEGWAVGKEGTIIRWNGAAWNNITSPTQSHLFSVFLVSADDRWVVGAGWGGLYRWTGTEWIPEFSAAILMLVLICLTLVAVILAKTTLRKSRRPKLPSKNQI